MEIKVRSIIVDNKVIVALFSQMLLKEYQKGERSAAEAAKLVGLNLPETPQPPPDEK